MQTDLEFTEFIETGTGRLTPRAVHDLLPELPEIRARIETAEAPGFPRLKEQLQFLAEVVEALGNHRDHDLPYTASLEAVFAITYFARDVDLIPDFLTDIGLTDDATVAVTVLQRHAQQYADFAQRRGIDWSTITPDAR